MTEELFEGLEGGRVQGTCMRWSSVRVRLGSLLISKHTLWYCSFHRVATSRNIFVRNSCKYQIELL